MTSTTSPIHNLIDHLMIKIYADGADIDSMTALAAQQHISGLTTNPTLMRQAGIRDYVAFAHDVLARVTTKPISFEVFADEPAEMIRQARIIASWADNVYVKIPVSTTDGSPCDAVVQQLSGEGIKLNVTALMTAAQVKDIRDALAPGVPSIISVFAGRIADTGRDPMPVMAECVELLAERPEIELIWASPRELLNVFQADAVGCHIITATPDVLRKLSLVGKDLDEYSVETVQMFHRDALAAGFTL